MMVGDGGGDGGNDGDEDVVCLRSQRESRTELGTDSRSVLHSKPSQIH